MSDEDNINRRSVLKNVGALGSIPLISGAVSGRRTHGQDKRRDDSSDIEIVESKVKENGAGAEDARQILNDDITRGLAASVEEDTEFTREVEGSISFDIRTDDRELNQRDPVMTLIPFFPDGSDTPTGNNSGVLFVWSMLEDGERHSASSLAFTREADPVSAQSTAGDGEVVEKLFGSDQRGSLGKVNEAVGSRLTDAEMTSQAEISAQDTRLTCWGCAAIVDIACVLGGRYLSYSVCFKAALASSYFGPAATVAAGGFCTWFMTYANGVSCALGTAYICGLAFDDCDFVE